MIPNTFVPMTTIESAKMNANFAVLGASGIIQMYGGTAAPTGWLLCDGSSLLRSTYPDLFAAIGTSFGSADGTHFNVPDFRGRVGVGKDGTTEFLNIGTSGGEKVHTLSIAELPAHYHTVNPPSTASGGQTANHRHTSGNYASGGNAIGYSPSATYPHGDTNYWNWNNPSRSGYFDADHAHWTDIAAFNSGNTGTDTPHNNLQPYLTINYIIKI